MLNMKRNHAVIEKVFPPFSNRFGTFPSRNYYGKLLKMISREGPDSFWCSSDERKPFLQLSVGTVCGDCQVLVNGSRCRHLLIRSLSLIDNPNVGDHEPCSAKPFLNRVPHSVLAVMERHRNPVPRFQNTAQFSEALDQD